jgi:hypothetical protein
LKGNEIYQTDYSSFTNIHTPSYNISKFTTAHELLVDRFSIEISRDKKKNRIELTIGDKVCFVKSHPDLICDTIVRGLLPKRHGGLESSTVYILVTDNKFDFYNIVEIAKKKYQMNLDIILKNTIVKRVFTIHQLAHFFIMDLERDIKKYNSKLFIITGDFFLSDSQITKEDKEWLYPQMIEAVKKVTDSILLIFSPVTLRNVINYESRNK